MKLSEKIQEALREQQEINLSDPAVQKRLAAQWGYVPAEAQPAPSVPDGFSREDLEAVADGLDGYEKTVNVGNVTGGGVMTIWNPQLPMPLGLFAPCSPKHRRPSHDRAGKIRVLGAPAMDTPRGLRPAHQSSKQVQQLRSAGCMGCVARKGSTAHAMIAAIPKTEGAMK